jgi:diacylglycerol kinase family enzyme
MGTGSPAILSEWTCKDGRLIGRNGETITEKSIIGIRKRGQDGYTILAVEEPKEQSESEKSSESKDTAIRKLRVVHTASLPDSLPESAWAIQLTKESLPAPSTGELHTLNGAPSTQKNANSASKAENDPTVQLNTHVVVSTLSGTGQAPRFYKEAVKPLLAELEIYETSDYTIHFTESATSVAELTASVFLTQANLGIAQRIILLSGDGGIVDVLNGIMSSPATAEYKSPVISLLPMGTGNALAHSSLLTKDNTLGLAALARGKPQPLPHFQAIFSKGSRLLVDEGRQEEALPLTDNSGHSIMYGAVVCSWGLHATLVADSDTAEYRKHGIKRFAMAAQEALSPADGSGPHRYTAKVSLQIAKGTTETPWTQSEQTEHSYVMATLVSNLEEKFTISPASKPLSGSLRSVYFGYVSGDEAMRIMTLAYQNGAHVDDEIVGYEAVDALLVDFGKGGEEDGRWRRVCVDGKIVRVDKGGFVEVRKDPKSVLELTCLL